MKKRHLRALGIAAVAGLAFEFTAFSDFDGARANDLHMLEAGGGSTSSGSFPPPNVLFIFDTSGSMNNHICEDFNGTAQCDNDTNATRSGPNSSQICYNQVLDALTGIDADGDGTSDPYVAPFASDGHTWNRHAIYPVFDERTSAADDDTLLPWATYSHTQHNAWNTIEEGRGGDTWARIEDVINRQCSRLGWCERRSRCIYSLRTQGYFYEEGGNCNASGDPMGICGSSGGDGYTCAGDGSCTNACARTSVDSDRCTCGSCDEDSDCASGTCKSDPTCAHLYCSDSSCTVPADCTTFAAKALGSCCDEDTDCDSGICDAVTNTCSTCETDTNCDPASCVVGSRTCAYSHCDNEACSAFLPGSLGASCSIDTDCNNGMVCRSSVCSTCITDSDCAGSTNLCVTTGCSHGYCSETGRCTPGSGGDNPYSCPTGTDGGTHVFLGDFMNFYPPKSFALIKGFTNTVEHMGADARIGVADFGDNGSGDVSYELAGDCDKAKTEDCLDVTTSTKCFDPDDTVLRNYLYNTLSFGGGTPLAIALDNAGRYYATSGSTDPKDPICDYSAFTGLCSDGNVGNYVVLISDGLPSGDATSSGQLPHTGASNGDYSADGDWVDDVADALTEIDHRSDLDGTQAVNTYTISFGLLDENDPTLCHGVMEEAAVAGGGQCFPAASSDQLRDALTQVIAQVQKKIHGFAAPATSATRRTDSSGLAAALFRPSTDFPLWEGHVFGLQICDETLEGSTCTCPVAGDDICVVDATGGLVTYDNQGYMTSTPYWDAQLCLAKDPANPPPSGLGPDQAGLSTTNCYLSPADRNIYTVVDSSTDGSFTIDDPKIEFSTANVTASSLLLAALNTGGNVADAQEVVNFFRGYDTGDYDADGNNTEPRNLKTMLDASNELVDGWWVLGDIFHSIPNAVTHPDGRGLGSWAETQSYKAFQADNESRIKAILVGANDGMLHAFHAGAWDSTDEVYDNGLGKELWAFVSPELLPRLKDICDPAIAGGCGVGNHRYLVDGSVMVRDVWIGSAGDDKADSANKNKWKTVAIYGHRRGGTTYVALDVTDITNPVFLWQFPQPGSAEESLVAQSWLDVFPAPASMGPLYVDNGSAQYDRWVALLSGGYDPTDTTGNALFVVDAYTGEKLWSATKPGSTSGTDLDEMKYSFPATPVFYSRVGDGLPYISGIVAADHGGQLWHVPIGNTAVDLSSPSLTPEIVFRAVNPATKADGHGGDGDGEIDSDEYQTRPFFFAPTLTRLQGHVRVIIGTGDRDHMVPYGTLSPTDGTRGTKCEIDDDCDEGLECDTDSGRCSDCNSDADCSDSCIRDDTTCLYSYCDDASCVVPIEALALEPDVNDMICSEQGRLYSVNLARCPDGGGGTRPCHEGDLQEITVDVDTPSNSVYSTAGKSGWYYILDEGEKVATPFEIINKFAMYTTFYPTVGCGRGGDICSAESRGVARLYARHYVTGAPLDWDADGSIVAGEAVVDLGSGVPTAPAVSVGITGGQATPTLMAGGSDSGLKANAATNLGSGTAVEIARFPVSRPMHDALH